MKKILVLNGPNLSKLGSREIPIYGEISFDSFLEQLKIKFPTLNIEVIQSNHEGALIDTLLNTEAEGVILNAGAYSHTSIALRDAVKACGKPVVEVHISNVFARENFRHFSYITEVATGSISGFGLQSYELALHHFA